MSSSAGGRARAYRVRDNVQPRSAYPTNRNQSGYTDFSGRTQVLQYPKSVITFEFYDPPPSGGASGGNMSDPSAPQLLKQSPQRRPGRVGRASSPKPVTRHQVGMKKHVGGTGAVGGGGKMLSQRASNASPTAASHYHGTSSGYFTITAYLPYDGGKRLKLQCTPGMTVQQVIETEIPDISRTGYQVYHFPSRALLNPEKDAGVLQDQEICIEPMRLRSPGEVNDKRLVIVGELLKTEDTYLESLRNIFDVYMEPLRRWSLPQTDMNVMFRSLSRLCDLLMNFFSELEIAVSIWDTRQTLIGGLFKQYPSFWDLYEEYSNNYPRAIRLLKEKCRNEAFNSFLDMKRGAARHTLESLMLLPVQRIYEYHRLLVQLFTITSKDHPDYDDLRHTVARVQHMVQSREHQLTQSENETKLDQVQARFPSDTLYLSETLETMETLARRIKTNSPATGVRGNMKKSSMNDLDQLDAVDAGRKIARAYVQEGPAKFISGLQCHDRYLFLFDDILLVAKPTGKQRSQQRTFRLKHRIRLSDLWMSEDAEPLLIAAIRSDTCLVVGWPVANNYVVQFSTVEEKELWSGALKKYCTVQLKMSQPDSLPITMVNHTMSSNQVSDVMLVHCTERVDDVLARALEKRSTPVAQANCQMLVKYSKDDAAVVLHGHELPFAIQAQHNRQVDGYVGEQGTKPGQLEFYMKRKNPPAPVEAKGYGERKAGRTRASRIRDWYRGRKREDRGKKGKIRLFGAPLSTVIINGQLPDILQEMVIRLYNEGPHTRGIFRITANYRKVKELKDSINNRQSVDISSDETSIHTVASLLKDFLRNVPGGILLSNRYTEFVATNDIKDVNLRVHHIQKILQKLPNENQLFLQLLLPLLHHITEEEEDNGMNSINLAICFAPSLLWPDSGLDVIKNEVPPLIQFMIEHSPMIFGREAPELFGVQGMLSPSPRSYRIPTKKTDGNMRVYRHRRNGSFETSTSEDSAGEDDMPSNMLSMRRSGLTVSDSQVSVISQLLDDEEYDPVITQSMGDPHGHQEALHHMDPQSPKRVKKSRPPERSSSYRGPNERPQYVKKYHTKVDEASRRKSIATQTTLQEGGKHHYSSSQTTPDISSLSQEVSPFIKSHQMQSFDENEEYHREEEALVHIGRRPNQKRKRGMSQYHQAFSLDQLQSNSDSHDVSYYDHLPPRSPGVDHGQGGRPRDLSLLGASRDSFGTSVEEEDERWMQASGSGHALPPILTSSERSIPTAHTSNQSITSQSSGSSNSHYYAANNPKLTQSRPSNLSLVSNASESSYTSTVNKGSPEPERVPLSREMIKYEITRRFNIPSRGNSFTGSTYSNKTSRSDSFNQEIDNIQRKFQERRRPEALNSISTASTTPQSGIGGVSSPPSFDDRPESERHLNSLPRSTVTSFLPSPPPQGAVEPGARYRQSRTSVHSEVEHDPNKLFVENNSDTESSPSRTLNRRERFDETKPRGVASRYHSSHVVVRAQGSVGRSNLGRASRHPPLSEVTIVPAKRDDQARTKTKLALTKSLPPQPQENLEEDKDDDVAVDTSPTIRPKSADGTDKEPTSDEEMQFRKRTMSDVEKAKLKLGLIPRRRRSKSISDTTPRASIGEGEGEGEGEIHEGESDLSADELEVHKMIDQEVRVVTDKMEKRGMWRAHAPNSSDRREAYTQRMKSGTTRTDHTSTKDSAPTVASPPAIQRTATAPEMGTTKRRATTMPEYLATRSSTAAGRQGRVLGRGLVRTVKITAYNIPEPRKIHRINLRAFH